MNNRYASVQYSLAVSLATVKVRGRERATPRRIQKIVCFRVSRTHFTLSCLAGHLSDYQLGWIVSFDNFN
jgi:hypothetical protein